ncbi:Imm72 family immunity protein [Paraburkholderia tropica]|uniref:Imm72 family immunity protein n=1 Tax=Paraburkholderia tropica TaxID=92647 RepID=UPI002AB63179|nr:Imm72 family immunity protein [Paraburkholderia tropica]
MMLNTLTMTREQEEDARAKAFYLLKKWTSLTFVDSAIGLYRDFLNAYAKQLDTPSPNQKELEVAYASNFLGALVQMDDGVDALRKGANKRSAYKAIVSGSEAASELLFGRSAHEVGRTHDPFFQSLGVMDTDYSDAVYATGFAAGVWLEELSCQALKCSAGLEFRGLLTSGRRADGGPRIFEHWNYEALFQTAKNPAWQNWPPGRHYPAELSPCPRKNESSRGEVESDHEIPVEGVWEPWFRGNKVGCPNYFIKGSIAHKYQLEGTDDEHIVRWRLLWEDRRYEGGGLS